MVSATKWNRMLPSIIGMLGDVFHRDELNRRSGHGPADILEITLPTAAIVSAEPEIADVTLEGRRVTFTRPGGNPELITLLGSDSEGPLLPTLHAQDPISLTPAIVGFATLTLIGIAELNHQAGDARSRDYIDELAARNIDSLAQMADVEFNGRSNAWQELVWKRAAMLRHLRAEMLARWADAS